MIVSFVHDVDDVAELKRVLLSLSEEVGRDLRADGLQARTVAIKLRWPDFTTITRQSTLPRPTDSTSEVYHAAEALLAAAVQRGAKVRLLGVRASNLVEGRQLSLFDDDAVALAGKRSRVDQAVDAIRERFGDKSIRRASLIKRR